MGISRSKLRASIFPFLGIIPGMRAYPLGNIDLPVPFGDRTYFRTETLIFEVVYFEGLYHAILGRLCYAKFMAVPNYTYLKLKMPGLNGMITVSSSFVQAYAADGSTSRSPPLLPTPPLHEMVVEGIPDRNESTPSSIFCPSEDTKAIEVDPNDPTKTVRMGTQLPTK
jgi:hypothetical protein